MNNPDPERQSSKEVVVENSYKQVFDDIERAATGGRLEPQTAYEMYEAHLKENNLDPTVYLSMAITSGGFARDLDLGIGDVIAKNTAFGTMARNALLLQHPQFSERDIILPSDLGKVKGWSQSDYLLFWFHTITGLTVEHSREVSAVMAPSLTYPGFVDKTVSADHKWRDYQRFTNDYVNCLRGLADTHGRDLQPNNVQAMVMILDGDMSLGARSEEALCRAIGIPPQFQYVEAKAINETTDLANFVTLLRGMGAQALGTGSDYAGAAYVYGLSRGETRTNLAFGLGFRKTGMMNAIFAAEQYGDHPHQRPLRHGGHSPVASTDIVLPPPTNEQLLREYYSFK